jgi:hypothetical protein
MQQLNPIIENNLKAEMKQLEEEKPYVLIVDYNNCKFISLLPDNGFGEIIDPTWTVYHIRLQQQIPVEPIIQKDDNSNNPHNGS